MIKVAHKIKDAQMRWIGLSIVPHRAQTRTLGYAIGGKDSVPDIVLKWKSFLSGVTQHS